MTAWWSATARWRCWARALLLLLILTLVNVMTEQDLPLPVAQDQVFPSDKGDQMDASSKLDNAAGHAALAICESLLLALTDLKLMTQQDSRNLLSDAAAAHRQAAPGSQSPEALQAVVAIIERILAGKNSTKHD